MAVTANKRDLLFVSYAYEDEVFARWLARKLALYGYGVWFDQIKILGGESWVEEVDVAIKERSARVIAILSQASFNKPNPRKERTLALQISKQRKIPDFLITLKLDETDPDWTLSDISWISFRESWANGLQRLLKKLQSIDAPRIHSGNPSIAKASLDDGSRFLSEEEELITSNWLPFKNIPTTLCGFDTRNLKEEEEKSWPNYTLQRGRAISFVDPPEKLMDRCKKTQEKYLWKDVDFIHGTPTYNIINQILNRQARAWLIEAGCIGDGSKTCYIPDPFRESSIYRFPDTSGKSVYIYTSGEITIKRLGVPPETVIYHPSIRFSSRRIGKTDFVLQLHPSVSVFNKDHEPYTGTKVGPRRKKVTRSWYNEKWRRRLMAFYHLLSVNDGSDGNLGLEPPISLHSPISLNESLFDDAPLENSEDQIQMQVEVSDDEFEAWQE